MSIDVSYVEKTYERGSEAFIPEPGSKAHKKAN